MTLENITSVGTPGIKAYVHGDSSHSPTRALIDTTGAQIDPATQTTAAAILAKLSADPATQTTLAAILAKLIAAPATETTLAATNTALASILAKIIAAPATEASLAAMSAKLTDISAGEYETVAASQTAQVLGATGATGDFISEILVIPATTSPGLVTLLDNATSIPVFVGGASSVGTLIPFSIPLGMKSVSGAWKLTTGANVSCIAIGNFT
jgi:hypothetical protein